VRPGFSQNGRSISDREPAILCVSHLAWTHVWQRPQQLLSRLARHIPVQYVAEPEIVSGCQREPQLIPVAEDGQLRAWQPTVPNRPALIAHWRRTYSRLVADLLVREGWAAGHGDSLVPQRPLIAWFYTPTPWYLLDLLPFQAVVYDVMDELTNFAGAASDLPWREAQLLARSDLVFAGGRSLYAARRDRHSNVHCFPSGVDPKHFAAARAPETIVPTEIAALARPVLGYYGVIDERIDGELLAELAARNPSWSVVLVGPITKIDPASLPQAANLHYVGQQPYERLPAFLKGFDVCLMPFACNEATRSISPTKALEYLAAGKPVVSTPVPDVVAAWSEVVWIAEGAEAFGRAVDAVLAEPDDQRVRRLARQQREVERNDWEVIASEMASLLAAVLERRYGHRVDRLARL
jgi:UDP-galactopyranose mutase